ncbi:MAG: RNase H1/viroplasmin domain-containing protein [Lachnospiraceae bacterium]|nr:RNase H1/viroplasmin domain-containing protein [Lachnospiraceae bacterium]
MKYYAVRKGVKTGIFTNAKEFKESIKDCSEPEYAVFKSEKEAESYIARYRRRNAYEDEQYD